MFHAASRMLIILETLLYSLNIGGELIEECPLPWKPYRITATKAGILDTATCKNKCQGKAFHGKEGRLVCFSEREVAQRRRTRAERNAKTVKCECGYYSKSGKRNWTSINNGNIFVATKEACDYSCQKITIYLNARKGIMALLYWEEETRSEYYDIHAEVGNLRYFDNKWHSKYRVCTCGIKDTILKPLPLEDTTKQDVFEECTDPWKVRIFQNLHTVETCNSYCYDSCKRGMAFYYEGKPFCFHKHMPAKHRNIEHGGIEGKCECGYPKRLRRNQRPNIKNFFNCEPSVFKNNLKYLECTNFCSKFVAYLYITSENADFDVRCLYKPDYELLKPRKLLSKCDDEVYNEVKSDFSEHENEPKKFTICRCGLGASNRTTNVSLLDDEDGIWLPNAWPVKKKRSSKYYDKKT